LPLKNKGVRNAPGAGHFTQCKNATTEFIFCKIIKKKINNKKSFFPHITRQVPTRYQREGSKKQKKKEYMGRFGK